MATAAFKKRSGFSLAETIITVFIGLLVVIIVANTFIIYQRTFRKTSLKAELTQNARVALDLMSRELRQATDLVTAIPPTADDPELLPHEIQFEDGHDKSQITYIRFYLNGTDLYRQVIAYYFDTDPSTYVHYDDLDAFGGPEQLVVDDKIIGENFTEIDYYGVSVINIDMALEKNGEEIEIKTIIDPRNI